MTLYEREIGWRPLYDFEQGINEMLAYKRARLDESPPKSLRNVLVSSAARKIPLVRTIVEASRKLHPEIRIYAGDMDSSAPAQYVADGFLLLPPTDDANLDEIRDLCIAHDIGTVIPTRDDELNFWARNSSVFAQANIEIIVSHPDALRVSLDKLRFAEHGVAVGLPVIPAWLQPQGDGPFVVKERFGAGSLSIGLDLATALASAHAKRLTNPIFQPFVRGTEISVDAWIDRTHHVKGLVLRTRDRVVNGESTVTTTFRDTELELICRSLLESLPLRGPVVLQLIRDAEGHPHIIELNARFGGASTLSIAAGLDIWYWTLFEALGGNIDDLIFRRVEGEIRQIRVPSDLHLHDSNF